MSPTFFGPLLHLSWYELSPEVRQCVKTRLLNHLGASIAGLGTKAGQTAVAFAKGAFPGRTATIWGHGQVVDVLGAAFANATLASALDIDDGYRLAAGHPGAVVIPAALAVGQKLGITGQRFLESVLVGYEIATRTGQAMYAAAKERLFGSGAWASPGAAAATAFLLNLPEEIFVQALGTTEAYTPLSPCLKSIANGAMVKESIGWGGLTGITGALLAREGFTGVTPILLEPPYRDSLADLGHRFRVLDTYLKLYACCRWAHPAIEGVREILRDHDIRPEAITEVHVETFGKALSLNNPAPESSEAAQYSLPFAVAAFLLDGEVGPQQVVRGVSRPDILALARRIVITMDDDLEQRFPRECLARVTITTKDGRLFRSGTMACRGDPERPLSEEEIHMLFCQLVQPFVVKEGTTRIREAVETLEKMPLRRFIGIVSSCLAHV